MAAAPLQILMGVSGLAVEVRPDPPVFQEYPRIQVGDCLSRPLSSEFDGVVVTVQVVQEGLQLGFSLDPHHKDVIK